MQEAIVPWHVMPFYIFTHNAHILYLFHQIFKEGIECATSFSKAIFPFVRKQDCLELHIMEFEFLLTDKRLVEVVLPVK